MKEKKTLRLINADHFIETTTQAIADAEGSLTRDYRNGVLCALRLLEEEPEISAIPLGCLELELVKQIDQGSAHIGKRGKACSNIIDWYGTPNYQRCLETALQGGFIKQEVQNGNNA